MNIGQLWKSTFSLLLSIMQHIYFLLCLFYYESIQGQKSNWDLGISAGLSGVNELIVNDVTFRGTVKFNKKVNALTNKYRNSSHQSYRLYISHIGSKGLFKDILLEASIGAYSFSSTYFKEDKFSITFGINDTLNSPNWLISKYSLPFLELSLGKRIRLEQILELDLAFFVGYVVELYTTSKLILWDTNYAQFERIGYTFYPEHPNLEYDQFNYGLRFNFHLFPKRRLHPTLTYTQGLNDISRKNFYLNQHANIWSIHAGLIFDLNSKNNL